MKICDRCEGKQIGMILINQGTKEEIDLCLPCSVEFEDWRKPIEIEEKRKPGRPKKDGPD